MSRQEAYEIMMNYTWSVGSTGVEYWGEKDAEKMRECLKVLMYQKEDEPND